MNDLPELEIPKMWKSFKSAPIEEKLLIVFLWFLVAALIFLIGKLILT